ncbi:PAS domain S-box protein, partial [Paenibacillus sp. TAF58]
SLYQLTLVYHIIVICLIGINFYFIHPLAYVQNNPWIGLFIDVILFVLILGIAVFGIKIVKKRESSINETAKRYKSLYDNHPDSIISFSLDGEVLSANHGLESLLGLARETSMLTSFIPMINPPDLLKALHHFQVASAGMSQNFEAAFIHQKGYPIQS